MRHNMSMMHSVKYKEIESHAHFRMIWLHYIIFIDFSDKYPHLLLSCKNVKTEMNNPS